MINFVNSRLLIFISIFQIQMTVFGQDGSAADADLVQKEAVDLKGNVSLTDAQSLVKDAEVSSSKIQAMLDQARREKDLVLITCINDKFTQANANLQIMNQRLDSLASSLKQSSDPMRAQHEMNVISLISEKQKVLVQGANQCAGQDSFDTENVGNEKGSTKIVSSVSYQTAQMAAFEAPPETLGSGAPSASGTSSTSGSSDTEDGSQSGSNGGTVQTPPLIPPPVSPIN